MTENISRKNLPYARSLVKRLGYNLPDEISQTICWPLEELDKNQNKPSECLLSQIWCLIISEIHRSEYGESTILHPPSLRNSFIDKMSAFNSLTSNWTIKGFNLEYNRNRQQKKNTSVSSYGHFVLKMKIGHKILQWTDI